MAKIIGMDGGNTPPPHQPKIDLSTSKAMLCKECGYDVFIPVGISKNIQSWSTIIFVLSKYPILICFVINIRFF